MTHRERQILEVIKKDPLISQQDLAKKLGLSRSSVAVHIMNLMNKGYIKGKGYVVNDLQHVVVVGAANMDVAAQALQPIIENDSNPGRIHTSSGGVARNIAQNLALLGVECYLIAAVGEDHYGDTLMQEIKLAGVKLEGIHTIRGKNTSTYVSLLTESGDMQVAINDMRILDELTPALLARSRALMQHARALVLDCNLTEDALSWLFNHAGTSPIFVDTVSSFKAGKIRPWLAKIHTLKPNLAEAETLSSIKIKSIQDAPLTADFFHQAGITRVVISLGERGVFFSENSGVRGFFPPIPIEIKNANGAGDAMTAGLVDAWTRGLPFEKAVRFAQACSALTLNSSFTNNPNLSLENVEKLLEEPYGK